MDLHTGNFPQIDMVRDNDILTLLKATTAEVEIEMKKIISNDLIANPELASEALLCVTDNGHRMLSTLMRTSYEMNQRPYQDVLPMCAGTELLQVSALLVDDILDNAMLRNGNSSALSRLGTKESTVVGFVLASLGMKTMLRFLRQYASTEQACMIMEIFENVQNDVYVGQFMDLQSTSKLNFTEEQFLEMISKTTATFIKAPLVAGAILSGAPREIINKLDVIGLNLGLAYQLRDDVIDWLGDSSETGKPRFGDLEQRRMRLPLIHALRTLPPTDKAWLEELITRESPISDPEKQKTFQLLIDAGSIDYAIGKTEAHAHKAVALLDGLQNVDNNLRQRLGDIAGLVATFD